MENPVGPSHPSSRLPGTRPFPSTVRSTPRFYDSLDPGPSPSYTPVRVAGQKEEDGGDPDRTRRGGRLRKPRNQDIVLPPPTDPCWLVSDPVSRTRPPRFTVVRPLPRGSVTTQPSKDLRHLTSGTPFVTDLLPRPGYCATKETEKGRPGERVSVKGWGLWVTRGGPRHGESPWDRPRSW